MNNQQFSTLLGIAAIILWSATATLVVSLSRIPVFEILILTWIICFIFFSIVISIKQQWPILLRQPSKVWLSGTFGICMTHGLVVSALKLAPAAQTHMLTNLWPILIATTLIWEGQARARYLVGTIIGFIGVCIFILQSEGVDQIIHWQGYFLALFSNVSWVLYIMFSRHHPLVPSQMIGLYSGVGAVILLPLYLTFNEWVSPNMLEWSIIFIKGSITSGIAYYFWERGIKRGSLVLLNILYYFNPLFGVLLLVLFGLSVPTLAIVIGGLLIVIASLICRKPATVVARGSRLQKVENTKYHG